MTLQLQNLETLVFERDLTNKKFTCKEVIMLHQI